MLNPLISVIIPTFNRRDVILRSVNSVLSQTYQSLEVIIVDDGSSDDTENLICSLTDQRVKYYKIKNSGANAARNFGIKKASGDIIAFNDSDDEWLSEKLERQLEHLNLGFDASFCQMIVKRQKKSYVFPRKVKNNLKNAIFEYNYIGTPSLVIKKDILERTGIFDEAMPRLQDWDFAIRLTNNSKVGFLEIPLVNVYLGTNSITRNNLLLENSLDTLYIKNQIKIKTLPEPLKQEIYLKYARFYSKAGAIGKAFKMHKKANNRTFAKQLTLGFLIYEAIKKRF